MTKDTTFQKVFRPKNPKQMIGASQKAIVETLLQRVKSNEPLKRVLFIGPSGVGKTVISEIYIRALEKLNEIDEPQNYITYINCAAETGIDRVRQIILDKMNFLSYETKYRIFFLDELHGLSKFAQNSLLTPIENCPDHVIFIAATTEASKVYETLTSRFTVYQLTHPTREEMLTKVKWMMAKYDKKDLSKELIDEVIDRSGGNIRMLDTYMEQVFDGSYTSYQDEKDKKNLIHMMLFEDAPLQKLFQAAEQEPDYPSSAIGMCRYCIKVISNPRSDSRLSVKARRILQLFSCDFNYTDPKVIFFRQLSEYERTEYIQRTQS